MKKVLILSGSPRRKGNSDILCDEFTRGVKEAGHEVESKPAMVEAYEMGKNV